MFEVVLSQSILRSATQNIFYDCWLHAFSRKSSSCKGLCNSMIYTFVLSQTIALYDLKIDSQILQVCEPPTRCFAKNRRDGNIYWVLYVTLNSQWFKTHCSQKSEGTEKTEETPSKAQQLRAGFANPLNLKSAKEWYLRCGAAFQGLATNTKDVNLSIHPFCYSDIHFMLCIVHTIHRGRIRSYTDHVFYNLQLALHFCTGTCIFELIS